MAPLPANGTARMFVDYVTGNQATSQEHTVMVRYFGVSDPAVGPQPEMAAFLSAVGAANFTLGWRVTRVRLAAAGSDFSFPVPIATALDTFEGTNSAAFPADREAVEWTWQGRSPSSGRRVDFSLYGLTGTFPINFRFPVGGSSPTWVGSTVGALNGSVGASAFLVIDGSRPIWYQYVNANYNSYWESRLRSV